MDAEINQIPSSEAVISQSLVPLEPWQPLPLRAEEFFFSMVYAGAAAGSERWMTQFDKGQYLIRREAIFQGSLGMSRRVQVSRFAAHLRLPMMFSENDNGRIFETIFDRRAGTVTLKQNRDEATQALTQDYHDPLSIVQLLRDLDPEIMTVRVPMIGGTVLVTRLDDEPVETPWGEVMARAYYLRPGMGFIYIEAEAPYRPLKFVQAIGRFVLESTLTRTSEQRPQQNQSNQAHKRPRSRHKPQGKYPEAAQKAQQQPRVQHQTALQTPRVEGEEAGKGKKRRRFRKRGNKTQEG